jgi:aromatic-L-amino-acid decarboxylase
MRSFDMPPEDFRHFGREAIDWIAGYLHHQTRSIPVCPPVAPGQRPGQLVDALPPSAPDHPEPMDRILDDFRRLVVPSLNHWNHPRFHAYFSVSASSPGILAELLAAAVNTNGMLWKSCPGHVELEQAVLGWLRQWLGLPECFFGQIADTASTATLQAIAAARAAADPALRDEGASPGFVMYCSEHAHSSVEKGAMVLGLGRRNVRQISTTQGFQMDPAALGRAIAADLAAGLRPFCVVSTVGTTAVASIDPAAAIQDLAEAHGLWHHIDAAYAGPAAILPEYRWILDGAGRADSIVVNPHKWLFTPIDCSAFYCRRPEALRHAFSLVPEYLRTEGDPRAVNFMDYGVALGRRFRALKLWFVMRYFGREKVSEILRAHIALARDLDAAIAADPRFEIAAPTLLSLVTFRYRGSDSQNNLLIERLNNSGLAFLAGTVLGGRFVIRLAIGNIGASREDVFAVWDKIRSLAADLAQEGAE